MGKPVITGAFILMLIGAASACVVQVEAGQIGIQKLFGKIQSNVLPSGLHFINPLIDVVHVDVRTQNYTMSGVHDEGERGSDDAFRD